MTNLLRRRFGAFALCAMAISGLPAHAAATGPVAYLGAATGDLAAYLIDWMPANRASVVAIYGRADGRVTSQGAQRVVTLNTPISTQYVGGDWDPCINDLPQFRQDTLQVAVTRVSGSDSRGNSAVVELGTVTTLNGCNAGHVESFGALDDPGFATIHLAMALRPPVSDLIPGTSLAGPSEQPRATPSDLVAADILSFQDGILGRFEGTGDIVNAAFDGDQWLQLGLPSGARAYARIFVDRRTGAERWLDADWAHGRPITVRPAVMVKPSPGAGFGNQRQASRIWESGYFIGTQNPFYIDLYQNGQGERVLVDMGSGTESRTPITWRFDGIDIVQDRPSGSSRIVRTWKPLLNGGGRAHFAMEDEVQIAPDGSTSVRFPARVNYYVDNGPATPPPTR
jgi:hypothetical protein